MDAYPSMVDRREGMSPLGYQNFKTRIFRGLNTLLNFVAPRLLWKGELLMTDEIRKELMATGAIHISKLKPELNRSQQYKVLEFMLKY